MTGGKDCLCGGTGRIYDWNKVHGDPCPECTGGRMSSRGQANMQAYKLKQGCAVVALCMTGYIALILAFGLATLFG